MGSVVENIKIIKIDGSSGHGMSYGIYRMAEMINRYFDNDMKRKILITMLILSIILLSGCNSSYHDCKYDCLRYKQNCSAEGSFCIPPPCNTNHICNEIDFKQCIEQCSGGGK